MNFKLKLSVGSWPKYEAAGPQLRVRYREDSVLKLIKKRVPYITFPLFYGGLIA